MPLDLSNLSFDFPAYQSPQSAVIASVNCTNCENIPGVGKVGMASDITYNVVVNTDSGPQQYTEITPAHRRPNVRVIAAQPGDKCVCLWYGPEVYFIIIEPPYFKTCSQ